MDSETCEEGNITVDGKEYDRSVIGAELCSAFEGGSSSWASIVDQTKPDDEYKQGYGKDWMYVYQRPMLPGGSLIISDDTSDELHLLNLHTIERGIRYLIGRAKPLYHCGTEINWTAHFDPRYYNGDACTGDMFLQACLFGDVIFS